MFCFRVCVSVIVIVVGVAGDKILGFEYVRGMSLSRLRGVRGWISFFSFFCFFETAVWV
jgi:hypothetical protein